MQTNHKRKNCMEVSGGRLTYQADYEMPGLAPQVSIQWQDGGLERAQIKSLLGSPLVLQTENGPQVLYPTTEVGKIYAFNWACLVGQPHRPGVVSCVGHVIPADD